MKKHYPVLLLYIPTWLGGIEFCFQCQISLSSLLSYSSWDYLCIFLMFSCKARERSFERRGLKLCIVIMNPIQSIILERIDLI